MTFMRTVGRISPGVAAVVASLALCAGGSGVQASGASDQASLASELWLKARTAVGGHLALAKITGLTFDSELMVQSERSRRQSTLLLPNGYQQTDERLKFTLFDGAYWTVPDNGRSQNVVHIQAARRAFLNKAITLLIVKPEDVGLSMTARRNVRLPQTTQSGDVLSYTGPDAFFLDLFLDQETGLPIGFTWPWWSLPPGPQESYSVRFVDHQEVGGLKFPKTMETRSQAVPGGAPTTSRSTLSNVRLNPPDIADRFVRR